MTRTLLQLGLLSGLFALLSCAPVGAPNATGHGDHGAHVHPALELALPGGAGGDYSVYDLGSEWWNQHGEIKPLGSLAGKVQVVSMVYTHCSYTCPRILTEMKRIEAQIDDAEGLGFVLVSIDPERDTPGRLRHFAEATRLEPQAWTLLSGSDEDILELATLLGIKYREEGDGDFSHSNTLLVLNPAGEVVYRQAGLGEDLTPLLHTIRQMLPGRKALRTG
jgi:protein SCO1